MRCALDARIDVETVVIHRHRHERRAGRAEHGARAEEAGVFHPDFVAAVEQHRSRERERMLRAVRQDQLLGRASNAARRPEIGGRRLAERRVAGRIAVRQQLARGLLPAPRHQPSPRRIRERVERGRARAERPRFAPIVGHSDRHQPARFPFRRLRALLRLRMRHDAAAQEIIGQLARHISPVPDMSLQISLGAQLGERVERRVPRDVELRGEIARRRQARAGRQSPGEDGVAQLHIELRSQRGAGRAVQADHRRERCRHGNSANGSLHCSKNGSCCDQSPRLTSGA